MNITQLTDQHVLAAMDPNGATMRRGDLVAQIASDHYFSIYTVDSVLGAILQRMKRENAIDFVKGPGGGWRLSDETMRLRSKP